MSYLYIMDNSHVTPQLESCGVKAAASTFVYIVHHLIKWDCAARHLSGTWRVYDRWTQVLRNF